MNIGVFACDPGGHTGMAWGIFDWAAPDGVAGALQRRMNAGSATVGGDERTQIREITAAWQSFYRQCVRSALLPPDNVFYIVEDFIYDGGSYAGDSAKISTSLIWGVEGYRMAQADMHRGPSKMAPMCLQTASAAKSFATGPRLKEWGVWVVGKEHERSAWQHVAHFLARYRNQKLPRK